MKKLPSSKNEAKPLSRMALSRAVKSGKVDRIARGIYIPASTTADWDLLEATSRRSDATICLISALAYHELTDEIPETLDIAIPRGARIPAGGRTITWHVFDRGTFNLERQYIVIPGTELQIGIYSPVRSVIDAFRLRNQVGYDTARDALKEWLRRGGKPAEIGKLAAELPRSKGPLLHALELLT